VTDLEVELDFGRGMGGAVETETFKGANIREPRSTHHDVNEDRFAQAAKVFRHYFPCNRITPDGDLSRLPWRLIPTSKLCTSYTDWKR
jgi:hypothetical protein